MQVSKDAEKQKSLEENSRQIFLNYQQQVNDLNQRFKDYQLLEIEWRNRERSLDNDIDKLKAENMGLRSEISVLHIENAKLRSKLGMDSMPPKIVADVNLKSGESS
jgi:regulator of replication initiation timing